MRVTILPALAAPLLLATMTAGATRLAATGPRSVAGASPTAGEAVQAPPGAAIVLFKIRVPDAALTDLEARLGRTRFSSEIPGSGWEYGTSLEYVRGLTAYWREKFDWREQERRLNRFDQFKTKIDGLDIHFIRQRAKSGKALPLLLIHGYPDSFVTFAKVIDALTDPAAHGGRAEDAFDVIVPSLPGFGFSDRPRERGWGAARTAGAFTQLMARLGYTRYAVQGAGLGCLIATQMARHDPHMVAEHFNDCPVGPPPGAKDPNAGVPPAELERMKAREVELVNEQAYLEMNTAKPQTVGYELVDSPVGLAAWIVDKYRVWCDCGGDPEKKFTKDELLTNITIYWVTETGNSSGRIYRENRRDAKTLDGRVGVPTGYTVFPKNMALPPRAWMEARYNIARWTDMPRGGHFAALEEPELFVGDLRSFFRDRR